MASKFHEFLNSNKIDPRRILVASRSVEKLRPADRAIRLARRLGAKADAPKTEGGDGDAKKAKPRSGRPVTPRLLDQALNGKPITGPAKTRLLRAVNRVLELKKKSAAELKSLF